MGEDDIFDIFPDVDFDGDHDLQDALLLEDMYEEEEQITTLSYPAEDENLTDENDFEDDYDESDPMDCDDEDDYELAIDIPFNVNCELDKTAYPNGIAYRQAQARNYLEYIKEEKWYAEKEKTKRCQFIVADAEVASRYLTVEGVYLYAQAVKDHFKLPFDIPDEWDGGVTSFETLLQDLAEHDANFALEIWEWCLDTFMPDIQYEGYKNDLTHNILLDIGNFIDEFPACIVNYMVKNPAFIDKLILQCTDTLWCIEDFVALAIRGGYVDTARKIMDCAFANPHTTVHDKAVFIDSCIKECSNWEELETMELFENHVFPIVFSETDVRIKNKIPRWQQTIKKYCESVERYNEKYLYSRSNAWRDRYRGNKIDPTRYGSEEEYLADVHESKYRWRKYCSNRLGIDPANYETRAEYDAAVNAEYEKERIAYNQERGIDFENRSVYRFCKVKVDMQDTRYYYYLTGELDLKVGDCVVVPFGRENTLTSGQVMSIGECFGCAFPCHVGLIKTVAKKLV